MSKLVCIILSSLIKKDNKWIQVAFVNFVNNSTALWSCGHVLDWEVEGSNLDGGRNYFQAIQEKDVMT